MFFLFSLSGRKGERESACGGKRFSCSGLKDEGGCFAYHRLQNARSILFFLDRIYWIFMIFFVLHHFPDESDEYQSAFGGGELWAGGQVSV
jgi:hypothetical protein